MTRLSGVPLVSRSQGSLIYNTSILLCYLQNSDLLSLLSLPHSLSLFNHNDLKEQLLLLMKLLWNFLTRIHGYSGTRHQNWANAILQKDIFDSDHQPLACSVFASCTLTRKTVVKNCQPCATKFHRPFGMLCNGKCVMVDSLFQYRDTILQCFHYQKKKNLQHVSYGMILADLFQCANWNQKSFRSLFAKQDTAAKLLNKFISGSVALQV